MRYLDFECRYPSSTHIQETYWQPFTSSHDLVDIIVSHLSCQRWPISVISAAFSMKVKNDFVNTMLQTINYDDACRGSCNPLCIISWSCVQWSWRQGPVYFISNLDKSLKFRAYFTNYYTHSVHVFVLIWMQFPWLFNNRYSDCNDDIFENVVNLWSYRLLGKC